MKDHLCSECGEPHVTPDSRKETLNRHKLTMLKIAAAHVMETSVNDFKLSDLGDNVNQYTNWQKLRYHGLVHHVRHANGQTKRGHWLITRNGWGFLRGEVQLPSYVLVRDNGIVSRSDMLIGVRDIYYAEEYIVTNFDYFDDDGNMVGKRPGYLQPSKQAALPL